MKNHLTHTIFKIRNQGEGRGFVIKNPHIICSDYMPDYMEPNKHMVGTGTYDYGGHEDDRLLVQYTLFDELHNKYDKPKQHVNYDEYYYHIHKPD